MPITPNFARGVVRLAEVAVKAHDRRCIEDHPRLLREHRVDHRLGAVVDAFQVDVDHVVELVFGHVLQLRVHDDAGVVDQAVDAAPFCDRGSDHGFERLDVADVGHVAECVAARLLAHLDRLFDPLGRQVAHDDLGAFARELHRRRLAYASARAGNDRNLVL